jgi:type IV fimbrial biogenesis protein FimT
MREIQPISTVPTPRRQAQEIGTMKTTRNAGRPRQLGITLVEQLVGLAVTAVAAGTVAPALDAFTQRRELESAAWLLRTDVHHARSLAAAQNVAMRLQVHSDATGTCYVVHTGTAAECRCSGDGQAHCSDNAKVLRSAAFASKGTLVLRSNVASMLFDPSWGTVTPTGTLELTNRRGQTLKLVVNVLGRVRQCTTTPSLSHVTAC